MLAIKYGGSERGNAIVFSLVRLWGFRALGKKSMQKKKTKDYKHNNETKTT